MNSFSIVEPIVRDIKKLVSSLLTPNSPLDRIVITCNRVLALKDMVDLKKAVNEMYEAFDRAQEYMSELKRLLNGIKR